MNKIDNKELFKKISVDGYTHKFTTIYWDRDKVIRYAIGSFASRQVLDQCLSQFQKGTRVRCDRENLYTSCKGYVSQIGKSIDENNCDGTHALIYSNESRVIRVYKGENEVDKVFEYIKQAVQSGLINEWATYFYDELVSRGIINECEGFDLTEKAPKILIVSRDLDTELIRSIKSYGLKQGYIKLPVKDNQIIRQDMSFLEIIQELIIPYIEDQNCHYNVGEPISPILESPIVSGNNKYKLFPKQAVMTQGLLNAYKNNIDYTLFVGGTGVGKTYCGSKLSYALISEHFKKKSGRIALLCQGHLVEKWIRQIEECLIPLGIKPNIIKINKFTDVKKIPKEPKGIDVIVLAKDKVKRTWLVEHGVTHKYKSIEDNNLIDKRYELSDNTFFDGKIIFAEYKKLTSHKYMAISMEKRFRKKVIIYSPYFKDKEIAGYYISTSCKELIRKYGNSHKSFNFKFDGTYSDLKDFVQKNRELILSEEVCSRDKYIELPVICPHCGGKIYEKSAHIFDEENWDNYLRDKKDSITDKFKKCNNYIKADGSSLTEKEIEYIRNNLMEYRVVETYEKYPYLNEEGEYITGNELLKVKNNPIGTTVLIRVCGKKLFGVKNQTGYRCIESTKYMLKILGKNSIDVALVDEAHVFANASNQGESFANVCRLAKITIPMTGTLTGGKASDIFKILFRLCPRKMIENGYGYNDESLFIEHFGRRKRETIVYDDKYNKSGNKVTRPWKEIPGISPMLYNIFLSNNMISRKIEDMNIPLPKIRYFKHDIEMSDELKINYESLKGQFLSFLQKHQGINIGGSYINSLLSYPDMPQQETVYLADSTTVVAIPKFMELDDILLPKEQKLLSTVEKELNEGRRVLVFANFTGEKGVSKRLLEILSKKFKVSELKGSKVKVEKREEWINKEYKKGTEVLVTNPECISTGLDILDYPTIYFYEIPLNTKTLRQSEKRGYRPSQKNECRIYYSYYKSTIQEDLILLQSQKKRSSLALEGVFSEDMLSCMAEGGESIEAMLNKVLQGRIKLKESELDAFGFESEEVEYTFNNTDDGNVEVTKTFIGQQRTTMKTEVVENLSFFTIDEEFAKSFKKKSKAPVEGQIGFII